MMTVDEHLEWSKRRAREYLDRGDVLGGVTSMLSDLGKHPETKAVGDGLAALGLLYAMNGDAEGARSFVEGFR